MVPQPRRLPEEKAPVSAAFRTTQWSEVRAAGDRSSPGGEEALAELCQTYWYPLYAYVRGCGFSAEDAEDITQAFFARMVEKDLIGTADPARGRFRWFLLASLQNFLRNELSRARAQKRGGDCALVSWDSLEAEGRYQAEPHDNATPDRLYDLNWARAAMGRAFERLEEEFTRAGRIELFRHLRGHLVGGTSGGCYQELANRLGLSTVAIKVSVHRMRQRYRDCLRIEVARTVRTAVDVDDELRHLAELVTQ